MTLREQIAYIEQHEKGLIITACSMYRRRQVFEGDDGQMYVLIKTAGWDTFDNVMNAIQAIDARPDRYIIH